MILSVSDKTRVTSILGFHIPFSLFSVGGSDTLVKDDQPVRKSCRKGFDTGQVEGNQTPGLDQEPAHHGDAVDGDRLLSRFREAVKRARLLEEMDRAVKTTG
jgi:hypothetical protein